MLLLAGGASDHNILRLMSAATALSVPFAVAFAGSDRLEASPDDGGVRINGVLHTPTSLFARFNVFGYEPATDHDSWWRFHNWHTCLASSLPNARRLNAAGVTTDKMNNLRVAKACGLRIPRTVVSDVAPFDGIAKPLHGGDHTQYVSRGDRAPWRIAFFQEHLPGPEYRIYVIGDKSWKFSVLSPSLDYREKQDAKLGLVTSLGDEVAGIRDVMRHLRLEFAAVDMRDGPNGLCFLEINDGPMFTAFDDVVGNQISTAIVQWLTSPGVRQECNRSLTSAS